MSPVRAVTVSVTPVIDASTRLSMSLRPRETAIESPTPTPPANPAASEAPMPIATIRELSVAESSIALALIPFVTAADGPLPSIVALTSAMMAFVADEPAPLIPTPTPEAAPTATEAATTTALIVSFDVARSWRCPVGVDGGRREIREHLEGLPRAVGCPPADAVLGDRDPDRGTDTRGPDPDADCRRGADDGRDDLGRPRRAQVDVAAALEHAARGVRLRGAEHVVSRVRAGARECDADAAADRDGEGRGDRNRVDGGTRDAEGRRRSDNDLGDQEDIGARDELPDLAAA